MNVLFEKIVGKMLIAGQGLNDRNHETEIERVSDPSQRYLNFAVAESNDRKIHILDDSWSSSVHLLHKFPYSFVDDEIILFFFDIASEHIFVIK